MTLNDLAVQQRQQLQRLVNHHRLDCWRDLKRMREMGWKEGDETLTAVNAAYEAAQGLVVVVHTGRAVTQA